MYKILSFASFLFMLAFSPYGVIGTAHNVGENRMDSISYLHIGRVDGKKLIINKNINLDGKICYLPHGMTLVFNNTKVSNGTLVGDATKIITNVACFERVTIKGEWLVPNISTSMFCELNYDNSLVDVMALANPSISNVVRIEEGDYYVRATEKEEVCINIQSNTKLYLDGNIILRANSLKSYSVLTLRGNNISIIGHGGIFGDKNNHIGQNGEWGMGISLRNAHRALIKGISISDCWGDCIYISEKSSEIRIMNCKLDNGRRQGVSITDGSDIIIKACQIINVGGVNPQYAIDIEPNSRCIVDNVRIIKTTINNCQGGFLAITDNPESEIIGVVQIINCSISTLSKYPVKAVNCNIMVVKNTTTQSAIPLSGIFADNVKKIQIKRNTIHLQQNKRLITALNNDKPLEPILINGNYGSHEVGNHIVYN